MAENILKDFLRALDAEEESVRQRVTADRLGVTLRSTINELDWYFYNLKSRDEVTDEQQEQFYMLKLGASRLVRLALEGQEEFEVPTLTFRRTEKTTMPALNAVAQLGFIEHGRRVSDGVAIGLGSIRRTSSRQYEFTLPQNIIDEGHLERSVRDHYRRQALEGEGRLFESDEGRKHFANVEQLLAENVRVFHDHFIGYETDLFLDLHFFNIAYTRIEREEGFDAFRSDLRFGGVTFQKYVLTAIYFLSLCLKHEAFCEALIRKEPSIRLQDILTISAGKEGFIQSIVDALDMLGGGILGEPLEG